MLKNIVIDFADWFAAFAERRSRLWLNRSRWWADFADRIEHGEGGE